MERAAEHFAVDRATIWRWENYRTTPRRTEMKRIARSLGLKIGDVAADFATKIPF